nr:MAG TPA: hypothetical protein [Caudoviricetes sp.]
MTTKGTKMSLRILKNLVKTRLGDNLKRKLSCVS